MVWWAAYNRCTTEVILWLAIVSRTTCQLDKIQQEDGLHASMTVVNSDIRTFNITVKYYVFFSGANKNTFAHRQSGREQKEGLIGSRTLVPGIKIRCANRYTM